MNDSRINKKQTWVSPFKRLMISQGISILGSTIAAYAILWYVTLQTRSGIAVAGVTLTACLPQMLVLLPGGILADRQAPKWIIALSDLFIAASTLVLVILAAMGKESVGWILFFNALRSLGAGIQMPAVRNILPQIVPEKHLMKANSINTGIWSMTTLVSPGLAGMMLNRAGFGWTLMLDIITAAAGTGLLLTIPVNCGKTDDPKADPWHQLRMGFDYIKTEKKIRNCMIFYGVFQFLVVPASQLTPLLAACNLGQKVWVLSLAETAFAIGALLISVIMSCCKIPFKHFTLIGSSAILFGLTMVLILAARHVISFVALMLVMGMGSPLYYTPLTTYIQENTSEAYMGRVFSYVDFFSTLAMPLGMLVSGPLAKAGICLPFLFSGASLILLGIMAIYLNQ